MKLPNLLPHADLIGSALIGLGVGMHYGVPGGVAVAMICSTQTLILRTLRGVLVGQRAMLEVHSDCVTTLRELHENHALLARGQTLLCEQLDELERSINK